MGLLRLYKHSSFLVLLCLIFGACLTEPVKNKKLAGRKLTAPINTLSSATIFEDTPSLIQLTYSDGGYKSASTCEVTAPSNILLSICECHGGLCEVTATPTVANYSGTGSFRYTVTSELGQSAQTSVAVTIAEVNDPPLASEDFSCTGSSKIIEEGICNGIINAEDVDLLNANETLTFSIKNSSNQYVSSMSTVNGVFQVTNASTGAFKYTPTTNVPRGVTLSNSNDCRYTEAPHCSTATGCKMSRNPVNNSDLLVSGKYGVFYNQSTKTCFSTRDGGVTWNNLGALGIVATDFAIFSVRDNAGARSDVRVSVEVLGVNDIPTYNPSFSTALTTTEIASPQATYNVSLATMFTDVEGDALTLSIDEAGVNTCTSYNVAKKCFCTNTTGQLLYNGVTFSGVSACTGASGYLSFSHTDNNGIFLLNTGNSYLSWLPNTYGSYGSNSLDIRARDAQSGISLPKELTLNVSTIPTTPTITMPADTVLDGSPFLDGASPYLNTISAEGATVTDIDGSGVRYIVTSVQDSLSASIAAYVKIEFTNDQTGAFKISFTDPDYYGSNLKFNFKVCHLLDLNYCTAIKTFTFNIDAEDDAPRVASGRISFDELTDILSVVEGVGYKNIEASTSLYATSVLNNTNTFMVDDDSTFTDSLADPIEDKFEFILVDGTACTALGVPSADCLCDFTTHVGCDSAADYYVQIDSENKRKIYFNLLNGDMTIIPLESNLISMAGITLQVNELNLVGAGDDLLSQEFDIDFVITNIPTAPSINAANANLLFSDNTHLNEAQSPHSGNWVDELDIIDHDQEGLRFSVTSGAINGLGIVTVVDNQTGDYRFTMLDNDVNSFVNSIGTNPDGMVEYTVKVCKRDNSAYCSTQVVQAQAMDFNDKPTATLSSSNVYSVNQGGKFYITITLDEGGASDEDIQSFGDPENDWQYTSSNSAVVDSANPISGSAQVSVFSFTDNGKDNGATLVLEIDPKDGVEGSTQLTLFYRDNGISQLADYDVATTLAVNPALGANSITLTDSTTFPASGTVVICPANTRAGCEMATYTANAANVLSGLTGLATDFSLSDDVYLATEDPKSNSISFTIDVKGVAEFRGYSDVIAHGAKVDIDKELISNPYVTIFWNAIDVTVAGQPKTTELNWKLYREDITELYMEKSLAFATTLTANPQGQSFASLASVAGYPTSGGTIFICPVGSILNCESFVYDTVAGLDLQCNGGGCGTIAGNFVTGDVYLAPNQYTRVAITESEYEEVFTNSIPINSSTLSFETRSYTDTDVRIGKIYAYLLKAEYTDPSNNNQKTILESYNEAFRFIDVPIPPDNMGLVHRQMANLEMCLTMGRSISGNTIDPENYYRCDYKGPGAIKSGGNFYYDVLRHHFVDLYEAGCPYSLAKTAATNCATNGCISSNATNPSEIYTSFYRLDKLHTLSAPEINHGLDGIFYSRQTGKCSYTVDGGTNWRKLDNGTPADLLDLLAETEISFNSPKLPPLTHVNQEVADLICKNIEPKCSTYAYIKKDNVYYTAKSLGSAGELLSLKILDDNSLGDSATVSISGNQITLTMDSGETKAQTIVDKINNTSAVSAKMVAVLDDPTNAEVFQTTTLALTNFTGLASYNRYSCADPLKNPYPLWARSSVDKVKELPSRKLQVAASAWPSSNTSATVETLESGLDINTTNGCNTSKGHGLNFSNSFVSTDTLPGTNSSNIRALKTGSSTTSNCVSKYGIQDLIGNVREWTQDRVNGCAAGGLDYATYVLYTTTSGAADGIMIQYKNPNGTFGSDGNNLLIEISDSDDVADSNFSGTITGSYTLRIDIKEGTTTFQDVVDVINNDTVAKNVLVAALLDPTQASDLINLTDIGNDPGDEIDTFTSTEADPSFAYDAGTDSDCTVTTGLNTNLYGLVDKTFGYILDLTSPNSPSYLAGSSNIYTFNSAIENNYPSNTPINYTAWLLREKFQQTNYIYLPTGMPVYDLDNVVDNDGDNKEDAHKIVDVTSDENILRGDQIDLHLNSRDSLSQEACPYNQSAAECTGDICTGSLNPIQALVDPNSAGVYYFNNIEKSCFISTGAAVGNWIQINNYGVNRAIASGGAYTGAFNTSTNNQGNTGNKAGRFALDLINSEWSNLDDVSSDVYTDNKYTGFRCSIPF